MSSLGVSRINFFLFAIVFRRIKGSDAGKVTGTATMAASENTITDLLSMNLNLIDF